MTHIIGKILWTKLQRKLPQKGQHVKYNKITNLHPLKRHLQCLLFQNFNWN